ncbi:helix-turn-helix domain-containing protein [Phenylobacterium sp. VNQ135]|uniref:helix-turn-helix domain-containing protein n=1 Tax=Phenylobacterium sp. VNQ135 TaxID=3400922 RepID=UPI003C0DB59E
MDGTKFIGDHLRLARLTHGMSLEQIAESVGATRQYIHQIENGTRSPAPDLTQALADALGVRTDFFQRGNSSGVRPEQCHFRKQQTTPISVTSQVLARGTMLDRLAAALDATLGLPRVNFPDYPVSNLLEAELAAEKAREYWGLGRDGPITNMTRVVENAGAIVTEFKGLSERVDALSMDRPRPIIVRNDAKASLCRQRFDLAHECGHLVMHRGVETGDKTTEDQAHRFASAFLLPRAAFLREFPRGRTFDWPALFQMKLRWKVALRAIVRRAFDLGLINAAQYRTANIQLVKTGQAKAERYDDQLPLEQPELLAAAMSALDACGPNALRRLGEGLDLSDTMFELLTGRTMPIEIPETLGSTVVRLGRR